MSRAPILKAVLGVPARADERAAYEAALLAERGGPKAVCAHCQESLDRIAERAVGLMTADSIFAGLALFLADGKEMTLDGVIGSLALVQLVLAVGLLCTTLWLIAPGVTAERSEDEAVMRHGLGLVRGRTIRFTVALWLSGSAYLFILAQVLLSLI